MYFKSTAVGFCATVLATFLMAHQASAAFVARIETFPGTTLDTTTWAASSNDGGTVAQNNGLQMKDAIAGTYATSWYVTQAQTVPVGGGATATFTASSIAGNFTDIDFNLITNSLGSKFNSVDYTLIQTDIRDTTGSWQIAGLATVQTSGSTIGGRGTKLPGSTLADGDLLDNTNIINHPYTVYMQRLSTDIVEFQLFDAATSSTTPLATTEEDFTAFNPSSAPMYVSLEADSANVTFSSVAVPEPSTVAMGTLGVLTLPRRHRRRAAKRL